MKLQNARDGEDEDVYISGDVEGCLRPAQAGTSLVIESRLEDEDKQPDYVDRRDGHHAEVDAIAHQAVRLENAIVQ